MAYVGPFLQGEDFCAEFFAPRFAARSEEHVVAAHLDGRGHVLTMSEGNAGLCDAIELPIRQIVSDALSCSACAVIIAHNHPSGDPAPSAADIDATRRLEQALRPLGIRLYDHLILTPQGALTSFRRLGWL